MRNNPVRLTDPDGHAPKDPTAPKGSVKGDYSLSYGDSLAAIDRTRGNTNLVIGEVGYSLDVNVANSKLESPSAGGGVNGKVVGLKSTLGQDSAASFDVATGGADLTCDATGCSAGATVALVKGGVEHTFRTADGVTVKLKLTGCLACFGGKGGLGAKSELEAAYGVGRRPGGWLHCKDRIRRHL